MFHFDAAALSASLTIMWKGMVGIFAVMLLITAVVWLFARLTK